MASMVITKKPVEYYTFTATPQSNTSEDEDLTASPAYYSPSFTDHSQDFDFSFDTDHYSETKSPITPPSISDLNFSTTPKQSSHKRKVEGQSTRSEEAQEDDFGTFEDWLRWDENDPLGDLTAMNNPSSRVSPQQQKKRIRSPPEESVVFIEDPVSNSPLFQSRNLDLNRTSTSFNNLDLYTNSIIQPRETLFESPPTSALANPFWASQTQTQPQQFISPNFFSTVLSPQEEARLKSIAMPNLPTAFPTLSPSSRTSSYRASPSPPAHHINKKPALSSTNSSSSSHHQSRPQRKRKSTSAAFADPSMLKEEEDFEEELEVEEPSSSTNDRNQPSKTKEGNEKEKTGKGKKSSHNMIEKRYRNNLNDKIAELRDSVPSLRVMSKGMNLGGDHDGGDDEDAEEEDLQGLTPAHKLNKATILSKATEYISHLEKRNAFLTKENAGLKARVDAFEILLMSSRQAQQQQVQQQVMQFQAQQGSGGGYGNQPQGGAFGGRW